MDRQQKVSKLYVQNEDILSIVTSLIKCQGKWFDAILQDLNNVRKLEQQVEDGLHKVDLCGLPGKFKAWLLPASLSAKTEMAINIVKGSHYHSGCTGENHQPRLKVTSNFMPSSLVEEFKTRMVLTLRDSQD